MRCQRSKTAALRPSSCGIDQSDFSPFWFGYGETGVSNLDGDAGFFAVAFCFAAVAVARMTVWDSEDNGEGEPYERLDNQV